MAVFRILLLKMGIICEMENCIWCIDMKKRNLILHYLENVLPYIYQLWGRIVHLETYVENLQVVYSYDRNKVYRRYV